ncbi:MAG: flagellar hook capping FlgD N-terminal domain-containing protein [Terriglobia bacterium]|nr:flagellar hook capping FlgD N-terminal domain-containing protein [Terriglobia bacterium]
MLLLSLLDHVKQVIASPFESKPQAQAQTTGVNAKASSSTGNSGGTSGATNQATITANDFLTLLVTEIQNQDPTQQTDPMQYITQLVGVNSLEQLVQINQTLTTATGAGTTPTSSAANSATAVTPAAAAVKSASTLASTAQAATAGHLLPLGSNVQLPTSSETAVAQAFTHASTLPTQVLPPTQVPLSPEVMRALEHSIPGAALGGSSSLPALGAAGAGGAIP